MFFKKNTFIKIFVVMLNAFFIFAPNIYSQNESCHNSLNSLIFKKNSKQFHIDYIDLNAVQLRRLTFMTKAAG